MHLKKPGKIAVDGLFFDWEANMQLDVAPNSEELTFAEGDETDPVRNVEDPAWTPGLEYFADMDIQDMYATDDEENVYVRITMNPVANAENIPNDTSYHGGGSVQIYISVDPGPNDTTGLSWGSWATAYDYLIQSFPIETDFLETTGFPERIYEHKQTGVAAWDFDASLYRGARVSWNAGGERGRDGDPEGSHLQPELSAELHRADAHRSHGIGRRVERSVARRLRVPGELWRIPACAQRDHGR